jgi:hypothetical protein
MMKHLVPMAMINKSLFRSIAFLILLLQVGTIVAIAQNTDFKGRVGVKASGDFSDRISGSIELEQRFKSNLSLFDKTIVEPEISYAIFNNLKVGLVWRSLVEQNSQYQRQFQHRGGIFASYKTDIDDFVVKLKAGLQYGFDDLSGPSKNNQRKLVDRNSISVEYNWFGTKITPFAEYEIFCHLNHPQGAIFNQFRIKAGTAYRLGKKSEINLYYMFENEFNVSNPSDSHILGIGYSYKF